MRAFILTIVLIGLTFISLTTALVMKTLNPKAHPLAIFWFTNTHMLFSYKLIKGND